MDLEERTIDDLLERTCEVCGTALTEIEMHEAREHGRPFLCSVHAAEDQPAVEPEVGGEPAAGDRLDD